MAAGSGGLVMRVMLILLALCGPALAQTPDPTGLWRTFSDKTGEETGLVRVFEAGNALYGRIEAITDPARAGLSCAKCEGDRKDKPLLGLDIIRGLHRDGDVWDGGTIIDPETGSIYRASLRLEEGGRKLVVRGYLGISLLGRSQTWIRK